MRQVDLKEAIDRAIYDLRNNNQPLDHLYFFTGGTGFPDDVCIEYFKNTNVVVVTRDNKRYCAGKLLEGSDGDRSI